MHDAAGRKIMHPADAERKKHKKRKLEKMKKERMQHFEKSIMEKSPVQIQAEILGMKEEESRKKAWKIEVSKFKKDKLTRLETGFKRMREKINDQHQERSSKPKHALDVDFDELKLHRKSSIFYHPVTNPYGAPPAGQVLMYRHTDGSVRSEPPALPEGGGAPDVVDKEEAAADAKRDVESSSDCSEADDEDDDDDEEPSLPGELPAGVKMQPAIIGTHGSTAAVARPPFAPGLPPVPPGLPPLPPGLPPLPPGPPPWAQVCTSYNCGMPTKPELPPLPPGPPPLTANAASLPPGAPCLLPPSLPLVGLPPMRLPQAPDALGPELFGLRPSHLEQPRFGVDICTQPCNEVAPCFAGVPEVPSFLSCSQTVPAGASQAEFAAMLQRSGFGGIELPAAGIALRGPAPAMIAPEPPLEPSSALQTSLGSFAKASSLTAVPKDLPDLGSRRSLPPGPAAAPEPKSVARGSVCHMPTTSTESAGTLQKLAPAVTDLPPGLKAPPPPPKPKEPPVIPNTTATRLATLFTPTALRTKKPVPVAGGALQVSSASLSFELRKPTVATEIPRVAEKVNIEEAFESFMKDIDL
eukprot:TRINITY_DN4562_c1_g1_i1.p1 TRINITY_DN4562_c1_g1~~TRINITY_DN4562_c1_g1_i1.p1  ORF type:complete len:608 (+),score=109.46 TRINITY_DN4562_c1_g1_i1:81-1826(+)